MTPVLNHLWQSTLVVAIVFLLTLLLRKNSAQTRYWLWFAASVKFLIPFSLLVSAGNRIEWRSAPAITPRVAVVTTQVTQPFTSLEATNTTPAPKTQFPYLQALWAVGSLSVVGVWLRRAHRLRNIVKQSTPNPHLTAPIPVLSSPTLIEPGVIGVLRPVLLIPDGLHNKLSGEQMQAIVDHEMCHVRRRDNLAAIFHMAVESIFWFHPLVWWMGARLIEERERACDEEVLRLGNSPETYAESILNVCRFYVQSPLPCASGVTGSDLKQRVLHIMTSGIAQSLTLPHKAMLAACAAASLTLPLLIGVLSTNAQTTAGTAKYDVASIRPNTTGANDSTFGPGPGGGIRAVNQTLLKLVTNAYNVRDFQVEGGPSWMKTDRFDIVAKEDHPDPTHPRDMTASQRDAYMEKHRERLRNLLTDRFHLVVKQETREHPGYVLTVGKGGSKLRASGPETKANTRVSVGGGRGRVSAEGISLNLVATVLAQILGRNVVNQTGIQRVVDLTLEWTPDAVLSDPSLDSNTGSLFTAVQEQLGLKLESKKVPTEIIIVERVEKPTEN